MLICDGTGTVVDPVLSFTVVDVAATAGTAAPDGAGTGAGAGAVEYPAIFGVASPERFKSL